jgi:hypothetical protein
MIQVLPDEVVRLQAVRSRNAAPNLNSVAKAAKQLQRLAATALSPSTGCDTIYREISNLKISQKNLPLIHQLLERRIQVFLSGIEREVRSLPRSTAASASREMGVSVVTWQQD